MPASLSERRKTDRKFLEQLLDITKLDNYTVPVSIKADLRQYQQVSYCLYSQEGVVYPQGGVVYCLTTGWHQLAGFPQQVQPPWHSL